MCIFLLLLSKGTWDFGTYKNLAIGSSGDLAIFITGFGNLVDYILEEMDILNKDFSKKENGTKYGEFISSFFSWIGLKEQKKRTEELENITNKRNKK